MQNSHFEADQMQMLFCTCLFSDRLAVNVDQALAVH